MIDTDDQAVGIQLEMMEEMALTMLENPEMTLAQIHALKSFYGHENFATYLKSSLGSQTVGQVYRLKSNMRQSLAPSNQHLQTSNILQDNGNETATMKDYWEFLLRE